MKLRKLAWVRFCIDELPPSMRPHYEQYRDKNYIFLGEIPNQEGHALLLDCRTNKHIIVHVDELREATDEET